jgi:hypothetical protein
MNEVQVLDYEASCPWALVGEGRAGRALDAVADRVASHASVCGLGVTNLVTVLGEADRLGAQRVEANPR